MCGTHSSEMITWPISATMMTATAAASQRGISSNGLALNMMSSLVFRDV